MQTRYRIPYGDNRRSEIRDCDRIRCFSCKQKESPLVLRHLKRQRKRLVLPKAALDGGTTRAPFTEVWNDWELPVMSPPLAFPMSRHTRILLLSTTGIPGQSLAYPRLKINPQGSAFVATRCRRMSSGNVLPVRLALTKSVRAEEFWHFTGGDLRADVPECLHMMRKRKTRA